MRSLIKLAAVIAAAASFTGPSIANTVKEVSGPTVFLPLAKEAPAKLFVDPPIPERLAHGAVLIQYRTENFRVVPVFGPAANDVSPRVGHLHVTVDDLPWHWADASADNTVVVVGLAPGKHKVLLELATPDHQVLTGQAVEFVVPAKG